MGAINPVRHHMTICRYWEKQFFEEQSIICTHQTFLSTTMFYYICELSIGQDIFSRGSSCLL